MKNTPVRESRQRSFAVMLSTLVLTFGGRAGTFARATDWPSISAQAADASAWRTIGSEDLRDWPDASWLMIPAPRLVRGQGGSGPDHIRDNAFLVEEAANQEAGVVQHILNWVHLWDQLPQGQTRDLAFSYTMELPVCSQDHQFSFTTPFLAAFEKLDGNPATQDGGAGDLVLNYRYQLLANDACLWSAPRASLIVPTGDERFGLGNGQVGYQFNLPISRYGERLDFHFNAGLTYFPHVSLPLPSGSSSPRHDLIGYNLGGSIFWKPQTYLHFFVEALALWNQEIDDLGLRAHTTQLFLNPGVRYAVCQFDAVEWVLGVSVPVGLTPDTPDIGVFAYMSVEHMFR